MWTSLPPPSSFWVKTHFLLQIFVLTSKTKNNEKGKGGGEEEDLKYTWDFFPTWEFEFLVMRLSQVCQTLELLDFKCSYLRLNIHIDVF